jgi:hypothetical protein
MQAWEGGTDSVVLRLGSGGSAVSAGALWVNEIVAGNPTGGLIGTDGWINCKGIKVDGAAIGPPQVVGIFRAANADGASGYQHDGVILENGEIWVPTVDVMAGNQWHYGASHDIISGAPLGAGAYGWVNLDFPVGVYGKPVKGIISGQRHLFVLTDTGHLVEAGYNDNSIMSDQIGDGTNVWSWSYKVGPSATGAKVESPQVQKTVTDFVCSADGAWDHGSRYANGSTDSMVFLCSDGSAYHCGYGSYGDGTGGTAAVDCSQIETSAAVPIANVDAIYGGGGQYYRFYLVVNGVGIYAYGYNSTYGALGVGDTTNRSYATLTSFPVPNSNGGLVQFAVAGDESEGNAFALYGNGDLYGCGVQGTNKHIDNSGAHVLTPVKMNGGTENIVEFWALSVGSGATYNRVVVRRDDNSMYVRGYSGNSNFFGTTSGTTASTAYDVWQQMNQGRMSGGRYWSVAAPFGYNASDIGYLVYFDDGELWACGDSSVNLYSWGVHLDSNGLSVGAQRGGGVAHWGQIHNWLAADETITYIEAKRYSRYLGTVWTSKGNIWLGGHQADDFPYGGGHDNNHFGRWWRVWPFMAPGQA